MNPPRGLVPLLGQNTLAALIARWSEVRHNASLTASNSSQRHDKSSGIRRRHGDHRYTPMRQIEATHSTDKGAQQHQHQAAEQLRQLVYTAWTVPRLEFLRQQRQLSLALLPRGKSAGARHDDDVAVVGHPLLSSPPSGQVEDLCREAAEAYFALLLRHRCAPTSPVETRLLLATLVASSTSESTDACKIRSSLTPVDKRDLRRLPLPLGPSFPHIRASWAHTLAVISWAGSVCDGAPFIRDELPAAMGPSEGATTDEAQPLLLPQLVHRRLVEEAWVTALQLLYARLRPDEGNRDSVAGHRQRLWWAEHRYRLYLSRRLSTIEFRRIADRHERRRRVAHQVHLPSSTSSTARTVTLLQEKVQQYIALRQIRGGDAVVPRFSRLKYEGRGKRTLAYVDRNVVYDVLPLWISAAIVGGRSHPGDLIERTRQAVIEPVLFGEDPQGGHASSGHCRRRVPEWATLGYAELLHRITDHVTSFVSSLTEDTSWQQRSVATLLRPPSMSLARANDLIDGNGASSPPHSGVVAPAVADDDSVDTGSSSSSSNTPLSSMANTMDNLWLSWWLQLLWSLGPAAQSSLKVLGELDRECRRREKRQKSSCGWGAADGVDCVILSPEAAVALTTALLLHVGASCRQSADVDPKKLLDGLPKFVPFALPGSVTDPRVVFRWVADPSFYSHRRDPATAQTVTVKATASPDAHSTVCPLSLLLLGASPASASEGTLGATSSHDVVESAVIWDLNLCAVVARGVQLHQQAVPKQTTTLLSDSAEAAPQEALPDPTPQCRLDCAQPAPQPPLPKPAVIVHFGHSNAVHLRHLMAWYKPALISTSMHANCRSLVSDLAQFPWMTDAGGASSAALPSPSASPTHIQEGLVNRIDRGTSGVALAARCSATLLNARRAGMLRKGLKKVYLALVQQVLPLSQRRCATGNHADTSNGADHLSHMNRTRSFGAGSLFLLPRGYIGDRVLAEGQQSLHPLPSASELRSAATEYSVLQYYPTRKVYLVKVCIESGRRHQIRQHFAGLHHPLVGDTQYNPAADAGLINRVALHALEVDLTQLALPNDPVAGAVEDGCLRATSAADLGPRRVVVGCDVPDDMLRAIHQLQRENGLDGDLF